MEGEKERSRERRDQGKNEQEKSNDTFYRFSFLVELYIYKSLSLVFVPVTEEDCWKAVKKFVFKKRKASESLKLSKEITVACVTSVSNYCTFNG